MFVKAGSSKAAGRRGRHGEKRQGRCACVRGMLAQACSRQQGKAGRQQCKDMEVGWGRHGRKKAGGQGIMNGGGTQI